MPPVNVGVKVTPVPVPIVMVAGAAVKLEIEGCTSSVAKHDSFDMSEVVAR